MADVVNVVLGAGVTATFHPLTFAKVLIQVGHEPMEPVMTTTLFGKAVLCYPNIFQYVGYLRRTRGFFGVYSGLGARLTGGMLGQLGSNSITAQLKISAPSPEYNPNESVTAGLKRVAHESACESLARCAAVVISQPFNVVMVRHMCQVIGGENIYTNPWTSAVEVYQQGGWSGFFAGLVPRLLCEVATIWLANIGTHFVVSCLFTREQSKEGRGYVQAISALFVSQVTYPLSLVSNVMAVNDCGLYAGCPPFIPRFSSWQECYKYLQKAGALKRGSSMFWRYYTGPTVRSPQLGLVPLK